MAGDLEHAVDAQIRTFREGSFDQHAAVEAIDAAMRDADAANGKLGRHVGWLQDVKRRRKIEIEKGEWPRG